MQKLFFCLFLLLFVINILSAQEINSSELIENLVENIAEESAEDVDLTELTEQLSLYLETPFNINEATYSQLEELQFLSDLEVHNIISYIKRNGQLASIYELQLVENLSSTSIERLSYFAIAEKIDEKSDYSLLKSLKYGQNQIFLRTEFYLEKSLGFSEIDSAEYQENPNARYLGNRLKYYTRYKYHYKNKLMWGITAEKDAGEAFFGEHAKQGFDYYSAHLQMNKIGRIQVLALGDYQLKFGQGLVLWSGMATKKSAYVMNIRRRENGVQKYSSVDENLFMRGFATTINFGNFDISAFFSHKNIDANLSLSDTISDEIYEISSLQNTGFHRTFSELEDRKVIGETVWGSNLTYRHKEFKLGLTLLKYQFETELVKEAKPYNMFEFQGKENTNAGLNYQYQVNKTFIFGETAVSQNGQLATTNGAVLNLVPQISFSILHRYFQKGYQAYYSNAFGETGKTYNETGLYFGTEIHPYKKFTISAYFDSYSFMWLRSSIYAPSHGNEYFLQLDYQTSRDLLMYLKFKYEEKQENLSSDIYAIRQIAAVESFQVRYQLSYNATKFLNFKSRIEMSHYNKSLSDKKYGFLIYQDINYLFQKIPLKLNFRYAIFDTEDYDVRIYAYENDILYGFSIPAYYSKGMRTYFNLSYEISDKISLWFKYSQTFYSDMQTIGSGKDEIDANKKSQIKLQLRYIF